MFLQERLLTPRKLALLQIAEPCHALEESEINTSGQVHKDSGHVDNTHYTNGTSVPVLHSPISVLSKPARSRSRQPLSVTSPLPPSSPPASSSYDQRLNPDGANPDDDEDPFGFLAVEQKLKVQRMVQDRATRRRVSKAEARLPVEVEDSEEELEDHASEAFAFPTPQPMRTRSGMLGLSPASDAEATPAGGHDRVPQASTPKRRARKRKPLASPHSTTPGSSSMPSSPSPRKPARLAPAALEMANDNAHQNIADADVEGEVDTPKTRGTRRGKKAKAFVQEDFMAASKELEALLPRRSVRRAVVGASGKARAPGRPKKTSKDVAVKSSTACGRVTAAKKGAHEMRPKSKATQKKHPGNTKYCEEDGETFVLDAEERDKFVVERQARLEYYKKLESFEVEKENVYVV